MLRVAKSTRARDGSPVLAYTCRPDAPFCLHIPALCSLLIHLDAMLADLLVVDILVVGRELVDGATGRELDDAAGHGTDKLQVVGTEKDVARGCC